LSSQFTNYLHNSRIIFTIHELSSQFTKYLHNSRNIFTIHELSSQFIEIKDIYFFVYVFLFYLFILFILKLYFIFIIIEIKQRYISRIHFFLRSWNVRNGVYNYIIHYHTMTHFFIVTVLLPSHYRL